MRLPIIILGCLVVLSGCAVLPDKKGAEVLREEHPHAEEGAVYLLDSGDVKVWPDGSSRTVVRQEIFITGENGRRFGLLQIPYDADRQKVDIVEAKTVAPDGKIIPVDSARIRIVTPAELAPFTVLYPGIRSFTINFPSVDIGSIIQYEYRITTFKPLMEKHFWDGFYFQSTFPFAHSVYRLTVPRTYPINIHNFSVQLKEEKQSGSERIFTWEVYNSKAVLPETMMPPIDEIVPRVFVTSISSWDQIGSWFFKLASESIKETPQLRQATTKLVEDAATETEKIKRIYNFVCSNIRYVGLEIGIHGFKPHPAGEVYELRYGDCKDKAALTVTMLRIAGIRGYIALINTERKIEETVPFPGQFNHAIVAIPSGNSFLFLDPTSEVIPYPYLPPQDQNRLVLVPTENGAFLVRSEYLAPEKNLKYRSVDVHLDFNGNITAEVVVRPGGIFGASFREMFRRLKDEERRRALLESLNRIIPGATLKSFSITGIGNLDDSIEERYSFEGAGYGIKVGERMIFAPSLIEKVEDTGIVSLETRMYPIRFGGTTANLDKISYAIPDGFEIDACPEDTRIENEFGIYQATFSKAGRNTLTYSRYFAIRAYEVPPARYSEFRNFYRAVAQFDKLPIILRKK